jgi:hypothetical protein
VHVDAGFASENGPARPFSQEVRGHDVCLSILVGDS